MHRISIPKGARAVLLNLRYENHEAYVVGGCVRDSLLGKEPKDWDICTSATPDEVKELMHRRGIKTIDTGLQHGTVTVDMGTVGKYEVTTFRIDGNYTDGRHPDYVEFTESIYKDLSRRDFTINAMAYNSAGLIDPFHGRDDLQAGIIRCVGNPDERFEEDALRILRALRFAATYGFSIEEQTAAAIHKDAWMLKRIAAERINGELCKMLLGDGILNVLLNFSDVIATIIPEMEPCIGFEQNNKYHQYTVYEHIAHAVANYKGADVSVKVLLCTSLLSCITKVKKRQGRLSICTCKTSKLKLWDVLQTGRCSVVTLLAACNILKHFSHSRMAWLVSKRKLTS